jgi:hypothetical protein
MGSKQAMNLISFYQGTDRHVNKNALVSLLLLLWPCLALVVLESLNPQVSVRCCLLSGNRRLPAPESNNNKQ